jgi:hypothetical protein
MNPIIPKIPEQPVIEMNEDLFNEFKEVNRLIIVGNGFDIAHGLQSTFKDFIYDYCIKVITSIISEMSYQDTLLEVSAQNGFSDSHSYLSTLTGEIAFKRVMDLRSNKGKGISFKWHSSFLRTIMLEVENKNWVDIEIVYFDLLKSFVNEKKASEISKLNSELNYLKQSLNEYLLRQVKDVNFAVDEGIHKQFTQILDTKDCKPDTLVKDKTPDSIYILNFNYTELAKQYSEFPGAQINYIPIHGQLSGDDITSQGAIFGFGDELDDDYLSFEHQRNDEVFEHIKSFKYLQFNHYRTLLEFLESNPYQVQIFGHSCGVSDRTLLSTIFEHKNCISIKPFYHKKDDNDDYEQKSFAISRHFKSKAELRSKVVNKKYCEAMIQPQNSEYCP